MNYLQDGTYDAHLVAAHHCVSRLGKPMIEFLWKIDRSDLTVKSFLHLEMKNGLKNVQGIRFAKGWAIDWDGKDPDWFENNIETCQQYAVRLTVVNDRSTTDPTHTYTHVKWVNPRSHFADAAKRKAEECPKTTQRRIDPARFAELPADLKPTMKDTWETFCFVTSDWTAAERETLWFAIIGKVAPGKDQIDFTETEWSRVVSEMKGTSEKESGESEDD